MRSTTKTRARRTRAEVDAIVLRIAEMFASGTWHRGKSDRQLAKEYGVSVFTVRDWSTQASRLALQSSDPDVLHEIRVSTIAALERNARMAEEIGTKNQDHGALRTAGVLYGKVAEVAGVKYDTRERPDVNVSVNVAQDPSVRLLFDTIMAAVRTFPNHKDIARVIADHLDRLGMPLPGHDRRSESR